VLAGLRAGDWAVGYRGNFRVEVLLELKFVAREPNARRGYYYRTRVVKEQAMQRAAFWMLAFAVVATFSNMASYRAAAQSVVDPSPLGDDNEDFGTELPVLRQPAITPPAAREDLRAFLGITFDPRVENAAVARSVTAGSPADQSGVRAGDMIVSLNGQSVGSHDDVLATIARLQPGDVLDIEISRRVSVRARAVLDGQPAGREQATSYRMEAESLPAPEVYEERPPVNRAPADVTAPRPRSNYTAPPRPNTMQSPSRGSNVDRNDDSNERGRDNRVRGRFPFRRG